MDGIICKNCKCPLPKKNLPVVSGENMDCDCPIEKVTKPIETDKTGKD